MMTGMSPTSYSTSAYAEMFEERTGIPINQIVILVVTEDGVVQEFIKQKDKYIPMLIDAVDDFTTDWEKENEMVHSSNHDEQSDGTTPLWIPFGPTKNQR